MKIKFLPYLLAALVLSLSGCSKDDINDLQNQINNLNSKVDELEATQQQALLKAISQLQENLETINTSLVADLQLLQQEVSSNKNAVYYGNVITDADYTALVTQGATIVTGKVIASSNSHFQALAKVKLIGKNLEIKGGTNIALGELQNIGENLLITGISTSSTINLAKLSSIGGDVDIMGNSGLTSLNADELVLITGGLSTKFNDALTTLSFSKLDQVNEIVIDGYWESDPEYVNIGSLASLNLSSTNVNKDVVIKYVGNIPSVTIGNIGGSFTSKNTKIGSYTLSTSMIKGDFLLEYNTRLTSLNVPNLTRIEGEMSISFNDNSIYWNETEKTGIKVMPSFAALKYIGGDISIVGNTALVSMESFNSVTNAKAAKINISNNGTNVDYINVFNALTTSGSSQYSYADIFINEYTNWFNGFAALTRAKVVNVSIAQPYDASGGIGISSVKKVAELNGTAKLEGFSMLTDVSQLFLTVTEVTSFNAFASLNNFLNSQTYLTVYMPSDVNVGMCSMAPIFTKIKNGNFDQSWNPNKKAYFSFFWSEMDRTSAINQLLTPCGV